MLEPYKGRVLDPLLCSRHKSGTDVSDSFNIDNIWLSVNRDFFIENSYLHFTRIFYLKRLLFSGGLQGGAISCLFPCSRLSY